MQTAHNATEDLKKSKSTTVEAQLKAELARSQQLTMALQYLYLCFDDEGKLHEQHEDQLSIGLEKAEKALKEAGIVIVKNSKCAECGELRNHRNHWAPFGWHNFEAV